MWRIILFTLSKHVLVSRKVIKTLTKNTRRKKLEIINKCAHINWLSSRLIKLLVLTGKTMLIDVSLNLGCFGIDFYLTFSKVIKELQSYIKVISLTCLTLVTLLGNSPPPPSSHSFDTYTLLLNMLSLLMNTYSLKKKNYSQN